MTLAKRAYEEEQQAHKQKPSKKSLIFFVHNASADIKVRLLTLVRYRSKIFIVGLSCAVTRYR